MLKSTHFIFMSELCITVACFCIFDVVYQIHSVVFDILSLSLSIQMIMSSTFYHCFSCTHM